ncbi:MAG: tetratricopeptide repeat protein [Chitinispirillaceae bacterium]|nr:tetratricopeptide repeat protein [Chitinispirillaceae bacterium]
MNHRPDSIHTTLTVAAVTLLLLLPLHDCLEAKKQETDYWTAKENLTLRLGAEWHKIGVLRKESAAVGDVINAIRMFELYPPELTGFDDGKLVAFDKSIEILEKRNQRIRDKINGFKAPLGDAIAILREMVTGEPVESMFETLEKGDLKRITTMLSVKHDIDTLWQRVDSLLNGTMAAIGMPPREEKENPMENDFFTILKANLGLQSETYYERLGQIESFIITKANPEQITQIKRIEQHRIREYLSAGQPALARRKTLDAISLLSGKTDHSDFIMLLVRAEFMDGNYQEALSTLDKLPETKPYREFRTRYRLQSLYALHDYQTIIRDTSRITIEDYHGAPRNLILWILIESALAEGAYDEIIRRAAYIEKGKPFSLHVMHALARSYLARNDDSTALSILEQAQRYKTTTDDDRTALKKINIAVAQLYYELGNYDKSIERFYELLNEPDLFEQALFGIAWCYLQSGRYEKAETALRKIINQAPETSLGAEGILVLARRYLQKAEFAWKKHTYIDREKYRLRALIIKLDKRLASDSASERSITIRNARMETASLLTKVEGEKIADYATISSYYDNIDRLCSFITSHYYTGTFQEASFSKKRETILGIIDSIQLEIGQKQQRGTPELQVSNARQERLKIKSVVDKTNIFSTICLIDRYRWERAFIDWRKNTLRKNAANGSDTAFANRRTLKETIDAVLLREDSLQQYYSGTLQNNISRLLEANIDSSDACYLSYQLGELYYHSENTAYARAYDTYEKKVQHFEKVISEFRNGTGDKIPHQPAPPVLDHRRSMDMYRRAMKAQPDSPFRAAAEYSLAWCYNDLARFDSAYTHMHTVATQFPEHPHAPQAWMFCGEFHFDKTNLKDALAAFYAVMKYPESEWFDEALYKVAWTQYRLSNPEKAISSFLALVDLGGGKFGHALLEKESMDYIAISFSETDATGQKGLTRAAAFARKLGDPERGCQILHRLAQVFRDQGRNDMAKKTFNHILSNYPAYRQNPTVEAELLAVLERDVNTETSISQKYEYFKKYNSHSKWAEHQSDSIRIRADSTAAKMLYDAAISYHQLALQKNNDSLYHQAIASYTDYINHYPRSPLANECHYNLAEIQFSTGNYREAAEEYIAVSKRYPDSKYKETAAWNAIVASQNLLKLETGDSR